MKSPPDSAPSSAPPPRDSDAPASPPGSPKSEGSEAKPKKRRRPKQPKTGEEQSRLDANGRERPRFLLGFPDHPELAKLSRAFEAGDYAYVREHAPELAQQAEDDEVRRAALELAERIKPDPLVKYLLALSVALLVYLVVHAYASHGH